MLIICGFCIQGVVESTSTQLLVENRLDLVSFGNVMRDHGLLNARQTKIFLSFVEQFSLKKQVRLVVSGVKLSNYHNSVI